MILPTKGISPERSLIAIGSFVLANAESPRSPSEIWHSYVRSGPRSYVTYEWFCLAVSLLFAMDLVEMSGDLLERRHASADPTVD